MAKIIIFLSKTSVHLSMITHYLVEENIFAIIVYKPLAQKKYWNFILMIAGKLILNKWFKCLKKKFKSYVKFKNYEKQKWKINKLINEWNSYW